MYDVGENFTLVILVLTLLHILILFASNLSFTYVYFPPCAALSPLSGCFFVAFQVFSDNDAVHHVTFPSVCNHMQVYKSKKATFRAL